MLPILPILFQRKKIQAGFRSAACNDQRAKKKKKKKAEIPYSKDQGEQ